jgi:hypothetical protein
MNWISLIFQMVALRKSLSESHTLVESAKNMAEKGKRAVAAMLVIAFGGLFLFSGLLVAVIDLGLQIDKHEGFSLSGLQISGLILDGFGLSLVAASLLISRMGQTAAEPPRGKASPREERIKDILEEFLVSFLSRLVGKGSERAED